MDLDQLHLENMQLVETLRDKNEEVAKKRQTIASARKRKTRLQDELRQQQQRHKELTKHIE